MQSDSLPNMMQPTNFVDFNALDVLAAAASLHSPNAEGNVGMTSGDATATDEDAAEQDGEGEEKHMGKDNRDDSVAAEVVIDDDTAQAAKDPDLEEQGLLEQLKLMPDSENGGSSRPVVLLKDSSSRMVLPAGPVSKTFTVLRVNKQQMSDHSYAYICQLQNLKHEEDEGYSSRSSVDEEVDDARLISGTHVPVDICSDIGSPLGSDRIRPGLVLESSVLSPTCSSPDGTKNPPKIVIVSKDSNIKQILSSSSSQNLMLNTSPGRASGNIVLRTLLGQKPVVSPSPKLPPNVTIRNATNRQTNNHKAAPTSPLPSCKSKMDDADKAHEFRPPMSPPLLIPKPQTHLKPAGSNDHQPVQAQTVNSPTTEIKRDTDEIPTSLGSEENSQTVVAEDNSSIEDSGLQEGVKLNDDDEECVREKTDCTENKEVTERVTEKESNGEVLNLLESDSVSEQSCTDVDGSRDSPLPEEIKSAIMEECPPQTVDCDKVDITNNVPKSTPIRDNGVEAANSPRDASLDTENSEELSAASPECGNDQTPPLGESPSKADDLDTEPVVENKLNTLHEKSDGVELTRHIGSGEDDGRTLCSETCADEKAIHNQYIIHDDVPPVTKFRTATAQCEAATVSIPLDTAVTNITDTMPTEAKCTSTPNDRTALTSATGKAIPTTSLLKTPVLTKSLPGSVLHVIPMVNSRRNGNPVVAQVLPKTVQYLAVPMTNKSVVRMVDPKVPLGTMLVPASSVAGTVAGQMQLIPAISNHRAGLGSSQILVPVSTVASSVIHSTNHTPPLTKRKSMDSLPGSNIESLDDECFKTLERKTPTSFVIGRSGLSTPTKLNSDPAPGEKINLAVKSSDATERKTCSVEGGDDTKDTTSNATVGLLSVKGSRGLIPLGSKVNQREYIRIQGSQIQMNMAPTSDTDGYKALSECSTFKPLGEQERSSSPWLRPDDGASVATDATDETPSCHDSDESSCMDLSELPSEDSNLSNPSVTAMKRKLKGDVKGSRSSTPIWQNSELHPLIDHDYCMFTEFNAQIQSSIIATTESKVKTERKYNKKTKAARTKVIPTPPVYRNRAEKLPVKGKRGRYKKKDALRLAELKQEAESSELGVGDTKEESSDERDSKRPKEKRPMSERRKALADKEKKNYVKITGSYQDEFVYFATKVGGRRARKAPEIPAENVNGASKLPTIGGINVFDWYRDMSKTDKSSYFGSQSTADDVSSPTSPAISASSTSKPGAMPIHESEVVDLVCELSNMIPESHPNINDDLHTLINTPEPSEGDQLVVESQEESVPADLLDLNQMAEQVRNMLNSMGEAELQMLENLGDNAATPREEADAKPSVAAGLADTSFDGFLANFTPETEPPLAQGVTSSNLCDLDEINDNDLLATDIGNMNAILGELKSANGSVANQAAKPPTFIEMKLDKRELFPEVHTPSVPLSTDVSAPELTVVSMYWNDLPGLLITGKEFVRLVDIHKQVLPAKDTGILKKRCQMMSLPISNCSDLQRDFLIRYANAAKSKSTVIISKDAAKTLIGFYVHPKPRVRHSTGDVASSGVKPQNGEVEEKPVMSEKQPQQLADSALTPGGNQQYTPTQKAEVRDLAARINRKRKRQLTGGSSDSSDPEVNLDMRVNTHLMQDVKRSARLKHKKVHYADMVNGTHIFELNGEEIKMSSPEKFLEDGPGRPAVKGNNRTNRQIDKDCSEDSEISSDHENRDLSDRPDYPEDLEIRKLKIKGHRRHLSKREARRLKRLKEKVQKKEILRKLKAKRKVKVLERQLRVAQKSKRKLQETHAYTKKVNPEHCYAACPQDFKQKSPEQKVTVKQEVKEEPVEVKQEVKVKEEVCEEMDVTTTGDVERSKMPTVGAAVAVNHVNIKVEPVSPAGAKHGKVAPPETSVVVRKREPLEVLHRDNVHRVGQRGGHSQEGRLYLHLYQSKDSVCVQCDTCTEYFTIKRFLKHMHRQNCPDELLEVALPQKLEPKSMADEQKALWDEFEKKQKEILESLEREQAKKTHAAEVDSRTKSPVVKSEVPDLSPGGSSTRHSTRVRKRKQLHPIESYVYSKYMPEAKRQKLELDEESRDVGPHVEITAHLDKVSVGVTPVRATKVKVNIKGEDKQVIAKYNLKVCGPESSEKRSARVVARRMRRVDGAATKQGES